MRAIDEKSGMAVGVARETSRERRKIAFVTGLGLARSLAICKVQCSNSSNSLARQRYSHGANKSNKSLELKRGSPSVNAVSSTGDADSHVDF